MAFAGRTLVEVSDDDLRALLCEEDRASLANTLGRLPSVTYRVSLRKLQYARSDNKRAGRTPVTMATCPPRRPLGFDAES